MPRFKRLSLSIAGTASVALASLPLAIGPASAARVPVGTTPSIGVMEASSNASQFNLGSHRAQGASSDLVGQNQPKAIPFPKPTTTTTGEGPGGRTAKPTDLRPTPCRPNGPTPCTEEATPQRLPCQPNGPTPCTSKPPKPPTEMGCTSKPPTTGTHGGRSEIPASRGLAGVSTTR